MPSRRTILALLPLAATLSQAADTQPSPFGPTQCEGAYPRHLQGVCGNGRDALYWCWTDALVKTDPQGRILKKVPVANHHGDLCHHNGRVYVAVNLGKFNRPPGAADSWVYVYDDETLAEVARHPVPELVHGAGGMAWQAGRFIVIGGLPPEIDENYLYEYDEDFKFIKRHVLASGNTRMGIQTAAFAEGSWWFGCYGSPPILLRCDTDFQLTGKWEFNASVGIVPLGNGQFLIAQNKVEKDKSNTARLLLARADEQRGLVIEER
jgi:hypothetical protein